MDPANPVFIHCDRCDFPCAKRHRSRIGRRSGRLLTHVDARPRQTARRVGMRRRSWVHRQPANAHRGSGDGRPRWRAAELSFASSGVPSPPLCPDHGRGKPRRALTSHGSTEGERGQTWPVRAPASLRRGLHRQSVSCRSVSKTEGCITFAGKRWPWSRRSATMDSWPRPS
jgi:hypothetical protein